MQHQLSLTNNQIVPASQGGWRQSVGQLPGLGPAPSRGCAPLSGIVVFFIIPAFCENQMLMEQTRKCNAVCDVKASTSASSLTRPPGPFASFFDAQCSCMTRTRVVENLYA